MRTAWLTRLLCLMAVLGVGLSLGCNAFSAERQARRKYVIKTDLDRMVDDVDWFFALDEPSTLKEDTLPPYR